MILCGVDFLLVVVAALYVMLASFVSFVGVVICLLFVLLFVFFFKQKTAYEI